MLSPVSRHWSLRCNRVLNLLVGGLSRLGFPNGLRNNTLRLVAGPSWANFAHHGHPTCARGGRGSRSVLWFRPVGATETLLALAVARLLRGSVLAAALVVTLHDVLPPVAPLLPHWEYDIGYWLVSHPHTMPPHLHLQHHSPFVWLHWSTFITVGRPLLVGSAALAAPLAVASYFLALAWGRRRVWG